MSTPKELRKRIEALNRRKLPEERPDSTHNPSEPTSNSPATPDPVIYGRNLPAGRREAERFDPPPGTVVDLEESTAGSEVRTDPHDKAYVIETPLSSMEGGWERLSRDFRRAILNPASNIRDHIKTSCGIADTRPQDFVFMDIETTGLSSSPLFLIGIMLWLADELTVQQFFARDYAEETAVIKMYHEAAAGRPLLVSFNGKSFDVPFIRARAAANAAPFSEPTEHFDLLHVCRRVWGGTLPDCKLQTLESHICRRARMGDIPGAEIPDAYHAYVRTGNAVQMIDVLKHNLLDLVTLADLMTRLRPAL